MKTKFLVFVFLLISSLVMAACNQKNQYRPEAKIITAFNTKYPKADKVEWEAKQGFQVAEFYENNIECEAWFDNNGKWLMTKSDLRYSNLPQSIRENFEKSMYSNWKKEDINKIERTGMNPVYIVEVEKGGQETDLYYNEDGTLAKTLNDPVKDQPNNYMPVSPVISDLIVQKYPEATIIDTDMEKGKLEVDILDGGKTKEIIFNGNTWLSTSWEVRKAEVPTVVMEAFRGSAFGKYRIDDIHFYETPTTSYYLFDLEQGNSEVHLLIDPNGKIIQ